MQKLVIYFLLIGCLGWNTGFAQSLAKPIDSNPPVALNLSLDEAILLAVRDNPNVRSAKLSDILHKCNLYIQQWEFYPHYTLTAAVGYNRTRNEEKSLQISNNYGLNPGVSLSTRIGTKISVAGANPYSGHYNPGLSFAVEQPLLRGFGRPIVEMALNNARESVLLSRLNIEGVLRTTVTEVINAYLDVLSAQKTIAIDRQAVDRAEKSVEQTKIFIKAGRKAGNELVTVQADVARSKSELENDKNSYFQARYALLAAIGLDPNTEVVFTDLSLDKLLTKYVLPSKEEVKSLVLQNDIQYQTDKITLYGSKTRELRRAEDNMRWQLNFSANVGVGGGTGGGQSAGFNSLFNGVNQSQGAGLTLTIPIDDQLAKQSLLSSKIALKEAALGLKTLQWSKETGAINGWNNVVSAKRSLSFALDAEQLQEKTYQISYQKYLHGLIDSLELQSAQVALIQSQQALLNARVTYLKALVNLDALMGRTLQTWQIKVRN